MKINISFHENNSQKAVIYMMKNANNATYYLTFYCLQT